jgi:sugar/nucleoside kinase (ribokinase family)
MWCGAAGEDAFFARAECTGLPNPTVKLGAQGAAAKVGNRCCRAAPPAVTVADTTGAGDAFDAGFIDALLDDETPENRLRRACVVGALSTRAAGGLGALPNREEEKAYYELTSVR